ncbi:MAG: endonuclease/exonuclease/phosphatase family protein, partial [Verrucomicrobiales bacterium]|nr:endonuclease/exonuclease/phosphatase family protein [Verrucomicrobiales bacterium]
MNIGTRINCREVFIALITLFFVTFTPAQDISIRIAGWNMESGDSDSGFLKNQLGEKEGIAIWGLSEVMNSSVLKSFEQGAEIGEQGDFERILGTSGGSDRLGILFDTSRVELLDTFELHEMQEGNPDHRAALVAKFKGKITGQEFFFLVNHLARGNRQMRLRQAVFLNRWAAEEMNRSGLPLVVVGDFNMDLDLNGGLFDPDKRDPAYDAMIAGGIWRHLAPENMVKTQASDSFNTILDFVFVSNPPVGWTGVSRILGRAGDDIANLVDFDDDSQATDHRPVDALLTLVTPVPTVGDR